MIWKCPVEHRVSASHSHYPDRAGHVCRCGRIYRFDRTDAVVAVVAGDAVVAAVAAVVVGSAAASEPEPAQTPWDLLPEEVPEWEACLLQQHRGWPQPGALE